MAKAPRTASSHKPGALCFFDTAGGAFAALAAAAARAQGRDATAASTTKVGLPPEIAAVLAEVGAVLPKVEPAPEGAGERIDVSAWGHRLYQGEGELEKLALARIARDRIELRVEALLAKR
jgi:hypothetical protein